MRKAMRKKVGAGGSLTFFWTLTCAIKTSCKVRLKEVECVAMIQVSVKPRPNG